MSEAFLKKELNFAVVVLQASPFGLRPDKQPLAAVLVLVLVIGCSENSITMTSTASFFALRAAQDRSLSTSTMDNASPSKGLYEATLSMAGYIPV